MKNNIWLALAFVVVVGFSATEVQARGGGERPEGERREGGERPRTQPSETHASGQHRSQGNAVNRGNTVQNRTSQVQAHYSPTNQPFSKSWYADHPQAWQTDHPTAGSWNAASLGAATGWIGASAIAGATTGYVDGTIVTDDDSDDDSDQPPQSTQDTPAPAYQPQPEQASQLAQTGGTVAADSDWLPLGVYALNDQNQTEATAMVQLAVNKDGALRGSYYDVVSDQGQAIQGAVDKKTQRVAWTVGSKGPVVFETALANLTQATGPVSLHFQNGQTRQWSLTRMKNPTPTE